MRNFFTYLPPCPREDIWGASVTALGFSRVGAGKKYPLAQHPHSRHFSWERGRVLDVYQLVLISDGAGVLESGRPGEAWRLTGGQVFVLFPGVWHRYAPDKATGWVEHWIECRGRAFDEVRRLGLLSPDTPVIELDGNTAFQETLMRCHHRALQETPGNGDLLATLAVELLCELVQIAGNHGGPAQRQETRIQRARQLIVDRCDGPLDLASIAHELGMGYSHLRQSFRRICGVSAREFHSEIRMRRACDLLDNTDLSVKEIAEILGFSSAFHFSASFRTTHKHSPSAWRLRRSSLDPAALGERTQRGPT